MRSWIAAAAALSAALYLTLVATRNSELLRVNLLFLTIEQVPAWAALLGSLLLGVAAASLLLAWPFLRLRLRLRSQSRRITRLEQEVHGLRTLPLSDQEPRSRDPLHEG